MQQTPARDPKSAARRPGGESAFTLIEIVIVMAVIAVLASSLIVAVHALRASHGPSFETGAALHKAKALVENWEERFDAYPPSALDPAARANALNSPIEAALLALQDPRAPYAPFLPRAFSNTDGDRLADVALRELRDGWGHPLVYFRRDDYGRYAGAGVPYVNADGDEVVARPWRHGDGAYANPRTFQIYSMGPDGAPNTDDDILTWSRS